MKLNARNLLLKLGEAKGRYPAAWRLIDIQLPEPTAEANSTFGFALNRQKLRQARRREGRYLLRTNLCGRGPAALWEFYIQLVEIEAAFKNPWRLRLAQLILLNPPPSLISSVIYRDLSSSTI